MSNQDITYIRPKWVDRAPIQYQDILVKHDMWLKGIKGGECANLAGANLKHAYLKGANLAHADLTFANLAHADLIGANLVSAVLKGAILAYADLEGANLINADLHDASLIQANLAYADLNDADLKDAYLQGAYLKDRKLEGAYIKGKSLLGAYLEDTNLRTMNRLIEILIVGSLVALNIMGILYFKQNLFFIVFQSVLNGFGCAWVGGFIHGRLEHRSFRKKLIEAAYEFAKETIIEKTRDNPWIGGNGQ